MRKRWVIVLNMALLSLGLYALPAAGGDVDMVQVGNETTTGMAGEYDLNVMACLIAAGCRAVREISAERGLRIRVAVHLTDIQRYGGVALVLRKLEADGAASGSRSVRT